MVRDKGTATSRPPPYIWDRSNLTCVWSWVKTVRGNQEHQYASAGCGGPYVSSDPRDRQGFPSPTWVIAPSPPCSHRWSYLRAITCFTPAVAESGGGEWNPPWAYHKNEFYGGTPHGGVEHPVQARRARSVSRLTELDKQSSSPKNNFRDVVLE